MDRTIKEVKMLKKATEEQINDLLNVFAKYTTLDIDKLEFKKFDVTSLDGMNGEYDYNVILHLKV